MKDFGHSNYYSRRRLHKYERRFHESNDGVHGSKWVDGDSLADHVVPEE